MFTETWLQTSWRNRTAPVAGELDEYSAGSRNPVSKLRPRSTLYCLGLLERDLKPGGQSGSAERRALHAALPELRSRVAHDLRHALPRHGWAVHDLLQSKRRNRF